jgi:Arc/MetJ-type ribon-helix-helix transcriptional regulator
MESMKAKLTVTVEKNIVEWIDRQVKIKRFRNKSHAVEVALMHFIESER